ncbi:TonB-dependent receptor plug domain-containing protein [Steroidobacter sp.]|uniref:TonB-dependent receptor plug domain-containing protein n=1 Tax=Steroidobacter sp. TaxID=1978227 RepID=UPI0039C9C877
MTSQLLKSQQAVDMIDALRNTAGVSSNSNGPVVYNNLTIRGIPVDTRSNFKLNGRAPFRSGRSPRFEFLVDLPRRVALESAASSSREWAPPWLNDAAGFELPRCSLCWERVVDLWRRPRCFRLVGCPTLQGPRNAALSRCLKIGNCPADGGSE